jgi:AAA domain
MKKTPADVYDFGLSQEARRLGLPVPPPPPAATGPVTPYRIEGPADFARIRKPRFVVPGLVPEGGTFLLFAPSGHYKTTVMLLLLVLAANGKALDGSDIEPTPLLVVANEDAHGVKLRLLAIAVQHGLSLDNVRVLGGDERVNLDLPEDRDRLVATARMAFPGRRPTLLVDHYDVSVTIDPTDPKTGGIARDALRDLVARAFASAGLLAHTPWTTTDRAKLPVSLWANMDARMRLHKRDDGSAELFVEHVKNAESGFALEVRLAKVTVELEDGPCETVAADFATDATGAPRRGRKAKDRQDLSSDQKTALKAIARTVVEQPAPKPAGADIPDTVAGTSERAAIDTIARLLPTTTRTGSERKGNKQREHAARVLHSLHGRYLVRMVDGFVWLARAAEAKVSQSSQTQSLRQCDSRRDVVATSQTPFRGLRCDATRR